MTNDFDDLASAYLDGQLTESEAARVEGDPEVLARAAELRSLTEALVVDVPQIDETLKGRQLDSALAAFDDLGLTPGAPSEGPQEQGRSQTAATTAAEVGNVVAIGERRKQRPGSRPERGGWPGLLGAAAAVVAVIGGIGLLSQVTRSEGDDAAFDSLDGGEATTSAEQSLAAESALDDDEAMSDDVVAEEAMSDEASARQGDEGAGGTDDEGDDDAADDASSIEELEPEGEAATTSTTGGFFPSESLENDRLLLNEIPDSALTDALATGDLLAARLSVCAGDGTLPDGRDVLGFVPIAVLGVPGEVLVVSATLDPVAVVLTNECVPFE